MGLLGSFPLSEELVLLLPMAVAMLAWNMVGIL